MEFINSRTIRPYYNMALDEALLDWHSKGEIPPVDSFLRMESANAFNRLFSKS